ncbi:leiomodin-2 [Denticeps clupeoides]|uniref:Leiomodin-2 n=1 Tax=Denticeps clupeoides TaxID=299321 RepID=A0AAY4DE26_9TELE|nr:leiomodin-2 [Denticeps clupeoides]
MSTFGYRRELSKYEDLDEDELLASLSPEELQELEKELCDIDPDDNVPIGHRQRDQTVKTPTGTFSREALMKYWENETRKLLEEERKEAKQSDEDEEGSGEECMTEGESDASEDEKDEHEEDKKDHSDGNNNDDKEQEDEEEDEFEESEEDEDDTETNVQVPVLNFPKQEEPLRQSPVVAAECSSFRTATPPNRLSGNPTVVDEALEKVLANQEDTTEVNLNNIDNISQETLICFAEALTSNTQVTSFSLANTRADDQVAFAIAKMLRENRCITSLNIESNFISGKGVLALVQSLTKNSTLTELRFHNQRHICGGQVEMEVVKLLRENTTLLKLGYQFDLPGPRMSMTSILTRNQDRQRQRRMEEHRKLGGQPGAMATNPRTAALQKGTPASSPYGSPQNSPWSSPKLPHSNLVKNAPPAPPPPPPPPPPPLLSNPLVEKKSPTRTIAEVIKRHEECHRNHELGEIKGKNKSKTKKAKKGPKVKETSILKELKNALRPIADKRSEESRPSTPQRSAHDELMAAIRGSSVKSLRKVEVPNYLR